ncbi:tRNA (N(6)-L-threonylcarbamoyladenosine(37)-C(2))-methylthiotransferase MtaB [Desulfuromonas acetoxidans]|uniref:Threonylcarbamoyladenosine tRNA methylthiotransferase MtaB n=1 Tax=Desulfuromonas acetoxidans (strain DSM 684 / 11070) TaxID=281689 RepID=Q1JYQ2_DESA6|nr:tRNA (N(6)-L-threonylcarbamoyladenosine(37)-C(2))-methylthiotransferase MtaB [Desulfuromonas acetoxidans]EAT15363.1 MiaB-like tRNA modifying enzyme [Desulfuromonas acetoxidans DSM 684]MBF0646391.1 tRNA (N(6)-L-threonylcarbamoyladenosine(37)-C(2))-methylthiotransferase MtaB [Desulfuromonas acetoxidans]NVD24394.1 tRNA (N(6)-L-threonylcarbamoyladenosine(37)-C(2))-methylthiotransferase MtaB [Desulfuromonas acetoxidans]NVE16658.1 tRNA (N(6)-L-threonylcarbamoyladenosine(37)-C(2))-methylthiotransfe
MSCVSIVTLGCKANQFESAAMERMLREQGYQIVPFEQGAELVIVNTCTVTSATDAQSRKLVRRARRLNGQCRIVVTGCYAQIQPQQIAELPGVMYVIGNSEKQDLIDILCQEGPQVQVGDIASQQQCPDLKIASFSEHSRAFVQIQSGCNAFCSYCIIPYARGRSRSVNTSAVVDQVNQLVAGGYREVVLTGIHIGNYGQDLTPQCTLTDLLNALLTQTDGCRIRLGSIEPQEVNEALIDCVQHSSRICPHFHIPLQSGCDDVLQQMNRHYSIRQFHDTVELLCQKIPRVSIGIDVISGFPGETEAQHRHTCEFISSLPVHYLHVFPFSARPGTPAATMPDQIPGDIAKQRAAELRVLAEEKASQYREQFIGRLVDVVLESRTKNNQWQGTSAEYLTVLVAGEQGAAGELVSVEIVGVSQNFLVGTLS